MPRVFERLLSYFSRRWWKYMYRHKMQSVPAGYPIERLSGPEIVGYLLHWGLFGTLSVQLYLYYLAFPNDKHFIKYLVYGIYMVEFVQTILLTHDAFATFGYGFGDLDALTDMHFYWLFGPIMSAITACIGHAFYVYRIFILSKSRIVPIVVICICLTGSVAAIITAVYLFQAGNTTKLNNRKISIAVGIWRGGSALCDIIIAICMTYYLMRSNTCFRRTQIMVTKLIRLIVESGAVIAIGAILNLILFFAFRDQIYYITLALIIPKLYANSVYMVLNSRIRIMGGRDTYTSSTDMETMIRDVASHSTHDTQRTDGVRGQVSVATITKEVFSDDHEMGAMSEKPQGGNHMSVLA
ncbi:hypothetical protein IW261DRAFT_426718 [Armillaria novae-zelandiae]|uniref:DUF6534 domain-containing protein n=1 Tax=Armillaria novae-zelandiae TaxID=153914 RepID=A0AA39N6G8_9AGAR|nr:hypothetical protein IW261DRAFT_426718 [Armillaria novae-zelandiae]